MLRVRLQRQGRKLPKTVVYKGWIDPLSNPGYQAREAQERQALTPWIKRCSDIAAFGVIPVLKSRKCWKRVESKDLRVAVD